MKKKIRNRQLIGCCTILGAILVAALLQLLGVFENLELKTYDLRFRIKGEISTDTSGIVLVTVDDQSFVSLKHKWPFPRSYFARAIKNLQEAGAALIVLDIEFTEPSTIDYLDDVALAEAIQRFPNVILAGKIVTEFGSHNTLNRYPLRPLKSLLDAGASWAYANVYLDNDGFIRRYNLYQNVHGRIYFPLAIEALRRMQNLPREKIVIDDSQYLRIGKFSILKYEFDTMLIHYTGPAGNFPTYSLANVLDDRDFQLPDAREDTDIFEEYKKFGIFKDKVVFIGASANELQDNKLTPFFDYLGSKQLMPGVEMHANALNTMISGNFIQTAGWLAVALIVLILGGLVYLLSMKFKAIYGLGLSLLVILFYFLVTVYLFVQWNYWLPFIFPAMAFSLGFVANTAYSEFMVQQEKNLYRKTFQQYVARSVVDSMLSSGELPKFGGERKVLTVLFSDIRSFTTFSEKYPPEVVVRHLTEYLSSMVDVIFKNRGTLDKFVGDEIMAIYGAPYYFSNHAEMACLTALEMLARLRHLQNKWSQKEMEYFQIGIGINTGKVIVGNLGSIQLFDYTVIGDEVNLGARLEGANKHYKTTIIISESTYQQVKDKAIVRELDNVRVKGKKKPVRIYELRGMGHLPLIEKELIIDVYTRGLQYFRQRKWARALNEFAKVLRYFPSDGPSQIYTQRCLEFIEHPPAENWDGVFEFAVK